ncbi:MAG: right-handed parallel beta-helix repeat-containing protein [Deltaproteobacteria bacterium]|nr:right-handed parallel beta-helix repeat-containing protein [Deltaproteobacteria bacterium]
MTSDLQVPAGLTLTIKPGTTIYVQPTDSSKIGPEFLSREVEILVRGSLRAVGTAARPIVIKPISTDPEAILWSGLELVNSEQVQLEHLLLEQAEVGVLCLDASPQIRFLQVRRSRYGILLQQQSAPQITDSLLIDGEAGLFCWDRSAPQVSRSRIVNQQEEGLYLGRNCRGRFIGNRIEENDRGVVLPEGVSFDPSNRVTNNRQDFLRYSRELD